MGAEDTAAVRCAPPDDVLPGPRTNYRRWWNNPWSVVEAGGPRESGEWTPEDARRLATLVARAHEAGLWIRFYTLNGLDPDEPLGWEPSYDFGSRDAVGGGGAQLSTRAWTSWRRINTRRSRPLAGPCAAR